MRFSATSGTTVSGLFGTSMFAAIALALASPAYGQVLGVEAYLYGEIPVPPHAIADNYIERVILPGLPPELGPLWLEAKDAEQSMDGAIDAYFSSRPRAPAPDLRQTYLQTLLLLKQLRNAVSIREQLSLTPDSYSARAGEAGFLPAEARMDYLANAATYVAGGDNPQQAALKAAVTWLHDRDRRRGARVQECYFENPQTESHWYCVNMMMGMDQVFRDVRMAEMFPLDEQGIRELLAVRFGNVTEEMYRSRGSVIDAISLMLLTPCPKGASSRSCWPNGDFRRHRETAILNALEHREEYRAASLQRESQIAQANRITVENGHLSGFLSIVAAGMVALIVIERTARSERASANTADSKWTGHENDEWCYTESAWYSSGRLQINTYCLAYDGRVRGITGQDGSLLDAVGALLNGDHCSEVNGWCKPG